MGQRRLHLVIGGQKRRDSALGARGFEIEVDMFAECARNGLRIAEILITYRAREDRAGALHPL